MSLPAPLRCQARITKPPTFANFGIWAHKRINCLDRTAAFYFGDLGVDQPQKPHRNSCSSPPRWTDWIDQESGTGTADGKQCKTFRTNPAFVGDNSTFRLIE